MIAPRRFRDRTERAADVDARLARQLRVLAASTTVPRALGGRALRGGRRLARPLLVRWAIVAGLLLVTAGGATGAVAYLVNVHRPAVADDPRRDAPPPAPARSTRSTSHRTAPVALPPPSEALAPPTPVPEPAPPRRQPEPSRRPSRGAAVSAATAATAAGELTEEARLMGQALSALREPGGAPAALQALDRYDARFPEGALAMEAAAARAQALRQMGDGQAALTILDRLPIGSGANVSRWMLLRGELRAAAGRCADALVDFDRAWRGSTSPDIRARASAGRASCGTGRK